MNEDYSHVATPLGFKPCTREEGHEGPCALEEAEMVACPDCTDLYMSYGKGGWYRIKWLFGFFPWGKEWVRCETCGGRGEVYD